MNSKTQIVYLFIFFRSIFLCSIQSVYITLGNRFSDQLQNDLFIVGMMSPKKCQIEDLHLSLTTKSRKKVIKKPYLERNYNNDKISYNKFFYFFAITAEDIANSECQFNYKLVHLDQTSNLFKYRSNLLCKQENLSILFLGQHDHSSIGLLATENIIDAKFDLLILTGNHANLYHTNSGAEGDDYFRSIEEIITKKPVLILPGKRESFDDFKMFNSRFLMPMSAPKIDWDYFRITIQNKDIYFVNLQKYISDTFGETNLDLENSRDNGEIFAFQSTQHLFSQKKTNFEPDLKKEIDKKPEKRNFLNSLKNELFQRSENSSTASNWKIVITNAAFYCSTEDNGFSCINNLFLLKDFDDLFEKFKIHLILSSSRKYYESIKNVFNFKQRKERSRSYLNVGMSGCANFGSSDEIERNEVVGYAFNDQQAVLLLDCFQNYYKADILRIPDLSSVYLGFAVKNISYNKYFVVVFLVLMIFAIFFFLEFTKIEAFEDALAGFHNKNKQSINQSFFR